jgi:GT2 family glycosyltransferase
MGLNNFEVTANAAVGPCKVILVLVAFHPGEEEVCRLQKSLEALEPWIGYAVVANDHRPGEAVDRLAAGARLFLANRDNLGYGRAANLAVQALLQRGESAEWMGVLNTDLSWNHGTFEHLFSWLKEHPDVVLAVPQLLAADGAVQKLCKRHPTVLGLFSRRFIPAWLKGRALRRYDAWYVMAEKDYSQVFDVEYLSGCCMLMPMQAFQKAGGFDSNFFLYLEDADLTRSMAALGRTIHLPIDSVIHHWGRGNYRTWRLVLVNLHSAWIYFRKWGLKLW